MSFKRSLEDATSHFLRSQLSDCLAKLQDLKEIAPTKKSVVLQSIVMNNCDVCIHQLDENDLAFKSYEDILHSLKGLPPSRNLSIVKSLVHYNRAISILHESSPIQLETKAKAAAMAIEKHLNEVLQCLDESLIPVILLRCALSLSQLLVGSKVSDWTIPSNGGRNSKESWSVAMAMPAGCRILCSLDDERDVSEASLYDKMPLEAVQALLRCQQACQLRTWHQALKIIKHNKRLWKGTIRDEMTYVKSMSCIFPIIKFIKVNKELGLIP